MQLARWELSSSPPDYKHKCQYGEQQTHITVGVITAANGIVECELVVPDPEEVIPLDVLS